MVVFMRPRLSPNKINAQKEKEKFSWFDLIYHERDLSIKYHDKLADEHLGVT